MTSARSHRRLRQQAVGLALAVGLAGCGAAGAPAGGGAGTHQSGSTRATSVAAVGTAVGTIPKPRPQVVEPTAGRQATVQPAAPATAPVGDVHAHAPSIAQVRAELRMEIVAARVSDATYIDPLRYVSVWERTDQGVDANLPVGAPIIAPCPVKILAIIPDWYAGQPLVYFELLDGPDAGKVQYVAEEITSIARPGSYLQQGQVIARYARSGTGIEYGWSTPNGVTLAMATTGYEEGTATPAGKSIRSWLNSLGANAGSG